MLKRQTMIALGVAVLLGLVAVYLANAFLLGTERRAELSGSTRVAVAAVPLTYGVDVTPDKVRFVDFPNSSIPPGSFTTLAALLPDGKHRAALVPIQINEPILATKISGEGKGGPAGFAKGSATVTLTPEGDDTLLVYEVNANVGGKLAQLGSRIIDGFAKKMADQFFERFQDAVEGPAEEEDGVVEDGDVSKKGWFGRLFSKQSKGGQE